MRFSSRVAVLVFSLFGFCFEASSSEAQTPVSATAVPTYVDELLSRSRTLGLADKRMWQLLGHYRKTWWGAWRSQADGADFFLAGAVGSRDPRAELEASLRAFVKPASTGDPMKPEGQHPQCVFPARWAWLKQELAIDARRLPDQPCPLFESWRSGIAVQAATLVYATAFLNSPASMYGHTFLRLSRSTGEGNRLLDYAVNFAADVDTENGFVYALRGVTGGFRGRFYVVPFYMKVQEYSNIDSRDLWEYELALSPEQLNRLVMHTWETRSTHFNYFFFTRNCSYQLLSLLEVADPKLHLLEDVDGPRVIPADTVRVALKQHGLVRAIRPRPSLRTVMTQRKDQLNSPEVDAAEAWVAMPIGGQPPAPGPWSKERQAMVLDAAADYARFRDGVRAEPSEDFKQRERVLLLARGRLGVPPQAVVTTVAIDAPHRGHETLRLGLATGISDQAGMFQTLTIRSAIHDYLDPPRGYPEDAQLEMASVRFRFDDDRRRLRLDKIDAVSILSAAPVDRWVHSPSWKVWFGADNARELGCERPESTRAGWRCLYAGVNAGGGFAARLGSAKRGLMFALAETDVGVGPAFAANHNYRVGAGGEVGLVGQAGTRFRMQLGGRYLYYFLGATGGAWRGFAGESISLTRSFELRFATEIAGTYTQGTIEILGYL